MNKFHITYKIISLIFAILLLASCKEASGIHSTVETYYVKGPVSGASALLKNTEGTTVAGPVITVDGHATFTNVSYVGPVYVVFSGGSYIDEATGIKVTLARSFIIRSGLIDNSGSGPHQLTGSPITEMGFQRGLARNGNIVNSSTINNLIYQVADDFGLDNVDVITLVPTLVEKISGMSNEDRYGAVLAAISQQQLNEGGPVGTASLRDYISNNLLGVSGFTYATAVLDLLENTRTQSYINASITEDIISNIGVPIYNMGGSVHGLEGSVVLRINNGPVLPVDSNGDFTFSAGLLNGTKYVVTVFAQPPGLNCSIINASGEVSAEDVSDIRVNCIRKVNYVDFVIDGAPAGTFWYVGGGRWERETFYDCGSYTETDIGDSTISLLNAAENENLLINFENMTITSDPGQFTDEIFYYGNKQRPAESDVSCESTSNDHTPIITSLSEVEVNEGRTLVVNLLASDADRPPEELSFSLTENQAGDNKLFKITNFSEKARAACRAGTANQGHPEDPNNSQYFVVESSVTSLEACQDACNLQGLYECRGIEFRVQGADPLFPEARCELWKAAIVTTVPQPGYSCYTRESEKPSVLSFIDAPDLKVVMDADANNVYEVEVSVSDGPDGNISEQLIQVSVVPRGDYIGRSGTSCRAGTQNEGHPQDTNNGNYFTVSNGVDSVEDCQALCDAYPLSGDPTINCMGIEYRKEAADYADTTSRCELWSTPIVATTPQKEYACYIRDIVRDPYGPDMTAYIGDYKASSIDEYGNFVTHTMSLSQKSASELIWTEAGNSWTLTRTTDRNKLSVGNDYPNADGYLEAEVFWAAGEIEGVLAPSGLVYRTSWAHAKLSHLQSVYQKYINEHPSEYIRVDEAERQIRELKWGIAEQMHTPQAYRDYKTAISGAYGRTDEADRRIESFVAFVTAEIIKIEVDEDVPAIGEDNDLELFYDLGFAVNNQQAAPLKGWGSADLLLESIWQDGDEEKYTNIDDGADRAFFPVGNAENTLVANETQSLRYGGLMFEIDLTPSWPRKPDCEDYAQSGRCDEPGYDLSKYFGFDKRYTGNVKPEYSYIYGIYDDRWNGKRTWAGNVSTADESLAHTYFAIDLADLEYDVPKIETKTISFEPDEKIRLTYVITKRNQQQYDEYLASNNQSCDDPALKSEKRVPRSAASIEGPGFLIRNETDHVYSVSLNQVGPLYYGELHPGKIFQRDTAWGHFTIDAAVNLTGESKFDNWNVAVPIAEFTAEVLLTVLTAGNPITSIKSVVNTSVKKVVSSTASAAAHRFGSRGAAALAKSAMGKTILSVGRRSLKIAAKANKNVFIKLVGRSSGLAKDIAMDSALNLAFTNSLVEIIYNEDTIEEDRSWSHSGFYGSTVEMYHIVGGPRLPCLNSDGDIEIRSSDLEILSHDECKDRPDVCTLN